MLQSTSPARQVVVPRCFQLHYINFESHEQLENLKSAFVATLT